MPSQPSTRPTDLPMTGPITMLPLRDKWTLVTKQRSSASDLAETQKASDSEAIDAWEVLDAHMDRSNLGTTPSQSQGPSDSSSAASSTLIAPGLEDGYVLLAGPSAHPAADDGPALMEGPSLPHTNPGPDEIDIGPATSSCPGPYVEFFFGAAAKPSGLEFDSFTFGPGITNASWFMPGPLQFGSVCPLYSFAPWVSPDESIALFSPGPIFLFFEPELAHSGPLAFPGAAQPTISGPNLPQSPASACSSPETGVSPSLDIPSNQGPNSVGPETYTHGPGPSPNGPEISPTESLGPEPSSALCLTFRSGPRAHDPRMGPWPTSFGPGPHVYDTTLGPDPALQNIIIGPGPRSFGPGPQVYDTASGPGPATYDSIIGPGPISFGPGPTMYKYVPNIVPGLVLNPHAPSITVELVSVTREPCKVFLCSPCKKGFDRIEHLERHRASKSHADNFAAGGMPLNPPLSRAVSCPFCDRVLNRQDNLRPHLLRHMDKGSRSRTRQVSTDESMRMGLAHIDPRLRGVISDSAAPFGKLERCEE